MPRFLERGRIAGGSEDEGERRLRAAATQDADASEEEQRDRASTDGVDEGLHRGERTTRRDTDPDRRYFVPIEGVPSYTIA